jgi:hypothetical protein
VEEEEGGNARGGISCSSCRELLAAHPAPLESPGRRKGGRQH